MNFRVVFSNVLILSFLLLTMGTQSCADENNGSYMIVNGGSPFTLEEATQSYPDVEEDIWIFFERFEKAGQERGIEVDLIDAEVTAEFGDIETGAAGSCSTTASHAFHHITIDKDFWNDASVVMKEIILFHELGHCYLHKGHNDQSHTDGTCISIMRTGLGECIDNYNTQTRDQYLDELFGGI